MRRVLLALLLLLLPAKASAQEKAAWDPAHTYAWIVSVCEWRDTTLPTFKEGRRDDDFVQQLEKDGVPEGQVTYLRDSQATLEAMRRALHATVARSGEGTTLIVYYQGHGMVVHAKGTYFANYDLDTSHATDTGFAVSELSDVLANEWKGNRLLLVGDCCHSGALASIVARYEASGHVRAACLASATASNRSTGHWTFTEALIDALEGDGQVDEDRDGTITFAEVDKFVSIEMRYREGQLSHAVHTTSFEESFAFRTVDPLHAVKDGTLGPWKLRDYCEAQDFEGNWYIAQVTDEAQVTDGTRGATLYHVHFLDFEPRWDEWVAKERLRPVTKGSAKPGDRYQVEWEDRKLYPGIVVDVQDDFFFFVHYENEAGEDDEWVTRQELVKLLEHVALAPADFAAGEPVAASWHKAWFLATVTSEEGELVTVRYGDGDVGTLTAFELRELVATTSVAAGDRVLACRDGKPRMYPGAVASTTGSGVVVRWDDGTEPAEVPFAQVARESRSK